MYKKRAFLLIIISICLGVGAFVLVVFPEKGAAQYINSYRDTLSNSAPGEYSNHTIEFTLNTTIPPGGYMRIRPGDGDFSIATDTTFNIRQVELYVAPPSQAYVKRIASTTPTSLEDGVAITYGSAGEIDWTLNSTVGIAAGSGIRIRLGNATALSTTTDVGILNPTATGTQPIYIEAGGGAEEASAVPLVAIIEHVAAGPVDTRNPLPPIRSHGSPSGVLSGLVTAAEVFVETNRFATCRYSTAANTDFYSMNNEFTNTGTIYHTFVATGLLPQTTYNFYVRCIDLENQINIDDYLISFITDVRPAGTPGTGSTTATSGGGTGTGGGTSGSGSGTGSGNNAGSQSGSGGSGGGGSGGGGLNGTDLPFPSGDGTVVVNGFAFPGSKVTLMVDGKAVNTSVSVSSSGAFTTTVGSIARGVYTFGVFATDANNVKSSTFSTTFTVSGSRESTLSNIHLMPTIKVTPDPVDIGSQVTFTGYAIANSTVTVETSQNKGGGLHTLTATSDSGGRWSASVSTSGFAKDTWKVRAKSDQVVGGLSSNFSQYTFYGVGGAATALSGNNSDLNRDGKVNLIDFSILLFHWNTDGGTSNPPADINRDGKVNLTDFSILIFNWTG